MIKLENYEVMGMDHAIRGMRNPMNSWDRSDSFECEDDVPIYYKCEERFIRSGEEPHDICGKGSCSHVIGQNDHKLMMDLAKGGSVHAKYRRMIVVYVDITAPLYWWKEFDTYKVGTVANSCSTMHKIHDKEFTLEDFSCEHLTRSYLGEDSELNMDVYSSDMAPLDILDFIKDSLNHYRKKYLEAKVKPMKEESKRAEIMKKYWWQMIQLLPSSYNQKRTIMFSYEVLANMYKWRWNHKLDEWRDFCAWIETLPYSEIITGVLDGDDEGDERI